MESEEAVGTAIVAAIIMSGLVKGDVPFDVMRHRAITQAQLLLKECEDAVNEGKQSKNDRL